MSTSPLSINSPGGAPLSFSGLATGLNTSAIISALMAAERQPVTRLSEEQLKVQAQQTVIQGVQTSLQQLTAAASEFRLPSLFESSQSVTSSEPTRVSAASGTGAGVGGYEVEVKQLANSSQRTFTFKSPASEDTITIDGQEFKLKAGGTAKELASAINSSSKASVFAAALENGTVVLSSRTTGATGAEFIKVSDAGGALTEVTATAKEGKDAEFTIDGVAGTSTSNTVTTAIPGVTLTLQGLTTTGPVTIDVQAPGASASQVEAQVQSFVKLYNSTVETIEKQLTTRPPAKPSNAGEFTTGTLFGDSELTGLLDSMRQAMYEPIAGLEAGIASPADIGISTGATAGSGSSQAVIDGHLTLETTKLSEAVKSNPEGVEKMLRSWSEKFQGIVSPVGGVGGTLESRNTEDASQITELGRRIAGMNELLLDREKALQQTFAKLESVLARNNAQANSLANQLATSSSGSSSSSSIV